MKSLTASLRAVVLLKARILELLFCLLLLETYFISIESMLLAQSAQRLKCESLTIKETKLISQLLSFGFSE